MEEAEPRREPQALGLALRDLLHADAKSLRRAIESRGGGFGSFEEIATPTRRATTVKGASAIQRLAGSLEAVASFVGSQTSTEGTGAEVVDPVVDPLLEHIVRPPTRAGGGGGRSGRAPGASADGAGGAHNATATKKVTPNLEH
jgi:hypothetical protein